MASRIRNYQNNAIASRSVPWGWMQSTYTKPVARVHLPAAVSKVDLVSVTQATGATPVQRMCEVFIEKLEKIAEVKEVYGLLDNGILRLWVVIDTQAREPEYQIYRARGDVYREFGQPIMDLLVLNRRDFDAEHMKEIIPTEASLVYPVC